MHGQASNSRHLCQSRYMGSCFFFPKWKCCLLFWKPSIQNLLFSNICFQTTENCSCSWNCESCQQMTTLECICFGISVSINWRSKGMHEKHIKSTKQFKCSFSKKNRWWEQNARHKMKHKMKFTRHRFRAWLDMCDPTNVTNVTNVHDEEEFSHHSNGS